MSAEFLDVVDETGRPIAIASRDEIHQKGLLHREVHVWLFTSNGRIIFQHRCKDKDTFPDKLDASVGGHVDLGMDFESTALKELEEETGIRATPDDLIFVDSMHAKSFDPVTQTTNNALRYEYALRYDEPIENLRIEAGPGLGLKHGQLSYCWICRLRSGRSLYRVCSRVYIWIYTVTSGHCLKNETCNRIKLSRYCRSRCAGGCPVWRYFSSMALKISFLSHSLSASAINPWNDIFNALANQLCMTLSSARM